MNSDKMLPQHDLDERNSLGRYEITPKGREALEFGSVGYFRKEFREVADKAYALGWTAAMESLKPGMKDIKESLTRLASIGR